MATQTNATGTQQRRATPSRKHVPQLQPVEPIREDDPTDPDNGDPHGWPEWTDRHVYTIAKPKR